MLLTRQQRGMVGGNNKNHNRQYWQLPINTLVNSASMVLPIGLPPKMATFCHPSNRLLVGRQCRPALWRLYFNSSAVKWLFICWLVGPQ